jgi:DNA-binding PadR family transcriptional regulator
MVVEQLAKAGFVTEQGTVRDTARPERTVYALTTEGRTELYDWMRELLAEPQQEYPQFGVALSFLSVVSPTEAVDLLTRRLTTLNQEIKDTGTTLRTAESGALAWVFLIEDKYRLAVLEAESGFVTELIESLQDPDYVAQWQMQFGKEST